MDVNDVLKRSGRSVVAEGHRTSHLLVIGQATLSMILLAGAGLMIESIVRLEAVPLGFRLDQILTARVALPPAAYSKLSQRSAFYAQALTHLRALPDVEGVALSSAPAPYNGESSVLTVEGQAPTDNLEAVNRVEVSCDYFPVLGVPLLQGRRFDSRDREGSQPVAIVNDRLVHKYFPEGNQIGHHIKLGKADDTKDPWLTIVGVVGSEKRATVYQEMGYVEPALVYLPVEQASNTTMALVMRVPNKPLAVGPLLQREISSLDRTVPVFDIQTMSERYSELLAHPRFRAILMGILAGLTLLLAAIGFYGLLAQLVSQRTQEIGVRMALGAQRSEVLGMVVLGGARLAAAGVLAGTTAGLLLTREMASLVYGVGVDDPWIFGSAALLLIGVALFACYMPAHRAAKVDPAVTLRYE